MKKPLFMTMIFTAAAGAALFAGGSGDDAVNAPGYGRGGFIGADGVDLISLDGEVAKDSYGNLIVDSGKTSYILAPLATLDVDIQEGDALEGEGFEGNTVYTKDGETFKLFHLTMVTVDGESSVIDLNRMGVPFGGRRDGFYGNADDYCFGCEDDFRSGMAGNGGAPRGGMMGYGGSFQGNKDSAPRGFAPPAGTNAEETSLSGTITYIDGLHPVLAADDGNYLIRMGHWSAGELAEGAEAEATGYVSPSLYTDEGVDYHSLILTSLTIDGKEVALEDFDPMYGGGMGFGGSMGGRWR